MTGTRVTARGLQGAPVFSLAGSPHWTQPEPRPQGRDWVVGFGLIFLLSPHELIKQRPGEEITRRREEQEETGYKDSLPSWNLPSMAMAVSQYRKRRPRVGWSCQHPGSGSASCSHDYLTVRKHLIYSHHIPAEDPGL